MLCIDCKKTFNINKNDYLPAQRCPDCRMRLLLSFRNERSLHKRNCNLCQREFIGTYPADSLYKVYCAKCWWSDNWDPFDFGVNYDSNRSFMDQFYDLYKHVPHLGMNVANSENSDYTNYSDKNKNCFLVINSTENENVYYSERIFSSKDCLECNGVTNGQLNYWNLSCRNCYGTLFSEYCADCMDCWFCYDCKSCKNCFGSFGLIHKQYVFFNQQLTEDEYAQKIDELKLNSNAGIAQTKQLVYKHWLNYPHRYANVTLSEQVSGDNVTRSKNCAYIFDADEMENCNYCYVGVKSKEAQYCAPADEAEHCANCMSTWKSYNTYCSLACWYGSDIWYSSFCMNSQNLFGCAGLRKAKYCILNKQYSEIKYKKLKQEIINNLKQAGIYGEFFPKEFSPFVCHETAVQEVSSEICKHPCKILKQEQELYQQLGLPNPEKCYNCRYIERLQRRNPRKLWQRQCMYQNCGKLVMSSYDPKQPEIIYCEEHYVQHYN
ncbi:MAG: hypothetical protein WCW27_01850 [Patescibacteria group bacterium]|jgi:DNA-directed RNA polymerase subunit RPC12/RpoP